MEKDIMDVVREKEFIALSEEERAELSDICSNEDEFNNLKYVFLNVDTVATSAKVSPKKETKKELDELFVSTYPKAAGVWYSSVLAVITPRDKPIYRQPLVQLAAVGLLVLLMVPFLNGTSVSTGENQLLASDETKEMVKTETPDLNEMVSTEQKLERDTKEFKSTEPVSGNGSMIDESELTAYWTNSSLSSEPLALTGTGSSVATSSEMLNDHPDGVFAEAEVEISYSIPTSEQPELLDLLTTTF